MYGLELFDMDGGAELVAQRAKTTSRQGHESLLAQQRTTGLTRSQSDHCLRFGTHAPWAAAADEVQDRLAG